MRHRPRRFRRRLRPGHDCPAAGEGGLGRGAGAGPGRDGAFQGAVRQPALSLADDVAEIFPVGVIVSLVSAGLLRNSRFMPAR